MITTQQALEALFALVQPTDTETVPLAQAAGRALAAPARAARDQPPFRASAMDGYALIGDPLAGDTFNVIGEAAAGHRFHGTLAKAEAVRIFTGAPVPAEATRVVIQEDVTRDGDVITITAGRDEALHIRQKGSDFQIGDALKPPRILQPAEVALLASMNCAEVTVFRKPHIALIATGDELVMPGENPTEDQIIASNTFGLKAMFERAGAEVKMLPIAKDTESSLGTVLDLAAGSDLIVTIGGASVGDHDIVGAVAAQKGLERSFYKIAMRPGKPLMAGRIRKSVLIGLPGNPVSSMVCGEIFILPVLQKMLGFEAAPRPRRRGTLIDPLPKNGPREHYMRARHDPQTGEVQAFKYQDSSFLHVLANASILIVRPPNDPARATGETVDYILL